MVLREEDLLGLPLHGIFIQNQQRHQFTLFAYAAGFLFFSVSGGNSVTMSDGIDLLVGELDHWPVRESFCRWDQVLVPASVDESLGDEIRVTVIATGIEDKPKTKVTPRPAESGLRGKVRDITPDDIAFAVNFDEPTFIRRKEALDEGRGAGSPRGYKGMVIDNSDLEVPTFLRKKAQ